MKIVVRAEDNLWQEIICCNKAIDWCRISNVTELQEHKDAEAYFNLYPYNKSDKYPVIDIPVFINSVDIPLSEINDSKHLIRINGWAGFVKRDSWEISGQLTNNAKLILQHMNKKFIQVNDEPGFISARILAMIINEAFFAREENVSTELEIDIAMRLGTNYPKGPFEWVKEIGTENIYSLLQKLSDSQPRYKPSPLLMKSISAI